MSKEKHDIDQLFEKLKDAEVQPKGDFFDSVISKSNLPDKATPSNGIASHLVKNKWAYLGSSGAIILISVIAVFSSKQTEKNGTEPLHQQKQESVSDSSPITIDKTNPIFEDSAHKETKPKVFVYDTVQSDESIVSDIDLSTQIDSTEKIEASIPDAVLEQGVLQEQENELLEEAENQTIEDNSELMNPLDQLIDEESSKDTLYDLFK